MSLVIHRVDGALEKGLDAILAHVGVAHPPIKLMPYEHREDAVGSGGAGNDTPTHPHTHTLRVPRDTQDGWSIG